MNTAMGNYPSLTVIIPTLNAEKWLEKLLTILEHQTLSPSEVLVIDSDSRDGTCDIARRHNARVVTIKREQFDHGGSRTMAAGMAQGEIVVFMTQDAVPVNKDALERLVRPLCNDEQIVATYGRQLATAEANFFSEHLRLFNYPATSQVRCRKDRNKLGFRTIFFSNSFAAYRLDALAAHGFFPKRLIFGEDTLAVAKFLENGYCVAYVSDACVYHSHNYTILQDFRRYFDIGVFHFDQQEVLGKFGGPGGAGKKYVYSELTLLIRRKQYTLLPESLLRNIGKFIAYQLGKRYKSLPRSCARHLSMNRRWWF